jgi:signal transduction histidine kinase
MTETQGITGPGLARVRSRPVCSPWLQVLWGAVPVAIALLGAVLQAVHEQGPAGLAILPHVIALSAGGAVLLGIRSARPVALALLAGALPWALGALSYGLFWQWGTEAITFVQPSNGFGLAALAFRDFCVYLTPLTAIALFHIFPTGLVTRVWARTLFALSLATVTVAAAAAAFIPAAWLLWDTWAIYWPALAVAYLVGAGFLVVRFVVSPKPVRRQIAAFGVIQICFSVALLFGSWSDQAYAIFQAAWVGGILASIAYGVARHRLYEVRIVVRRVFLYGLSTVVLTGVFIAVYVIVSAALFITPVATQEIASGSILWVPAAAACVVVLFVDPVRRRLLTRLERRYLGDRQRSLQAIARLNVDSHAGVARTYDGIVDALVTAVRAPAAELSLNEEGRTHTVATRGSIGEKPLAVPMQYRGELLGQIRVARRTAKEEYTAADLALLEQLAGQAAAHIFAVRRDQELSQSRLEALNDIAEERAKLGRDLHDGLAELAGAGLSAEALRLDLTPDSPAERMAAQLASKLQHASDELRRIAHGLDPGELSQGLDSAVGSYVGGLRGPGLPSFSAHLDVDHIPRALAQAAYMVVLEAIHNVVAHAAAHHAEVTMRTEHNRLLLRVDDDGCGIPQPYVSGFGITSMRRRVEALDGTFTIAARPSGGTRIQALIPIQQ